MDIKSLTSTSSSLNSDGERVLGGGGDDSLVSKS